MSIMVSHWWLLYTLKAQTHAHTHTHTYIHRHRHRHRHALRILEGLGVIYYITHTLSPSLAHTRTHIHTHTHIHTFMHTHTHTHTHAHTGCSSIRWYDHSVVSPMTLHRRSDGPAAQHSPHTQPLRNTHHTLTCINTTFHKEGRPCAKN